MEALTLPNRSAPYFSREEFDARLATLRRSMAERDLDVCLLSAPENIFYLTGLDHWGYFAPHLLIVPAGGEMVLVTRAMETRDDRKPCPQRPLRGACGQRDAPPIWRRGS